MLWTLEGISVLLLGQQVSKPLHKVHSRRNWGGVGGWKWENLALFQELVSLVSVHVKKLHW